MPTIYLWREGSLFCFVSMSSIELKMLQFVFLVRAIACWMHMLQGSLHKSSAIDANI
jgi:hypothetical protein